MRIVKLFLITIFYLGRYDTPILAQGVGEIGPIKLDAFPFIFRQDLLALDAHRHPYIERLGMMVRGCLFFKLYFSLPELIIMTHSYNTFLLLVTSQITVHYEVKTR